MEATSRTQIGLTALLIAGLAAGLGLLTALLLDSAILGVLIGVGVAVLGILVAWIVVAARSSTSEPAPTKRGRGMAMGMAMGIPLGVALSAALDNYAFIGVGVAIGAAIGVALEKAE